MNPLNSFAKVQRNIEIDIRRCGISFGETVFYILNNVKDVMFLDDHFPHLKEKYYLCNRFRANMGKSYTVSSLRILQDGNVAKVVGCSDAM